MIRVFKVTLRLAWVWVGLLMTCQIFAAGTVTHFRVGKNEGHTRLVFDLTSATEYVLFSLHNPDRLVIDFKNTDISKRFERNIPPHFPIENLRFRLTKDYLRIVIDLTQSLQAKSFLLPPSGGQPFRLVVDLMSGSLAMAESLPNLPMPQRTIKNVPSVPPAVTTDSATPNHLGNIRPIIIVIDPGHGGKDPGTTGTMGTHEKNVVLAIARYLQQDLNREPGFRAVLTRTGDYYIPLRGRLDLARKYKGDMFVSVHADAYPEPGALGASVFALSSRGATSEAARWLAEKENKSELLGGASLPDNDNVLRSVLIDLSQTNTISESLQIGSAVLFQLGKMTVLHHPRVEQAAFVVLKSPDIPSILVETGFLSTPAQERQLRNPQYQRFIANAIMLGIKGYFVRNPLPGTMYSRSE